MNRVIPTNKVTTEPTDEPVTVDDVKANAYIVDDDEDNGFIRKQLIPEARRTVEQLACRSLMTQTRKQYYDDMPCDILFRYSPLQSISSITYVDTSGTTQTLASTEYDVDTNAIPGRIVEAYGKTWPPVRCQVNSVTVTGVCGYGSTPESVPIIYRRAIILLCKFRYENRGLGCSEDELISKIENMLSIEGRTVEYA